MKLKRSDFSVGKIVINPAVRTIQFNTGKKMRIYFFPVPKISNKAKEIFDIQTKLN